MCCSLADDAVRKTAATTAAKSNKAGGTAPIDLDPTGSHYLTLDPIQEASTFIAILHTHAPHSLQTWQLSMQLARRKKRWLLAWRAILKANRLQPHDPEAHFELMALLHQLQRDWDSASDIVRAIIEEEWTEDGRQGDIQHADVSALNEHFLQQHKDSVPHRYAGQLHSHTAHSHPSLALTKYRSDAHSAMMHTTTHCHYH